MIGHAFILGQNEQSGASFSLSCAAQSFPAPTFRYSSKNTKFCLKKTKKKKKNSAEHLFVSEFRFLVSRPRPQRSGSCSNGPTDSSKTRHSKKKNMFKFLLLEPTSSSAPRMAVESFIRGQIERIGTFFSLSCAAQSYPAPTFRYHSESPKDWTLFNKLQIIFNE